MARQETPIVIIAGPTASGKSGTASILARLIGGEVINADSMQVYRDLRILSARPTAEEQHQQRHHLYGHVDGSERYSAGRFVREAVPIIESLREHGTVPILCGGTGLYLTALTEGLSPIPEIPPEYVARGEALWADDAAALRSSVLDKDPALERLKPADRQRHVRAWSVREATGVSLTEWQQRPRQKVLDGPFISAVLLPEREELYDRCDERLVQMMSEGALSEVRALAARRLPIGLPVMKALGVPELMAFLRGDLEEVEAVDMAAQETRRFAKRQMTWFRNQTDWPAFANAQDLVQGLAEKVTTVA